MCTRLVFSCLLFIGLVPLHWLARAPSFNVITFIWVIILCFGYFVDSIGNDDIDFIVITTLLIGPTICMRAVAIACFLGLLYACLLKQRTLPFIPFLSWGVGYQPNFTGTQFFYLVLKLINKKDLTLGQSSVKSLCSL